MKKLKKNLTIDDLAVMVAEGFDRINERFNGVDLNFIGIHSRLTNLENGQEAILLRLDNVAYRFEVKDLEKRVSRLEHKTGISK